jgi:hypothetical protein
MSRRSRLVLSPLALLALSPACSSSRSTSSASDAPDASLSPSAPAAAPPRAAQVVESLARMPAFADRVARHATIAVEGDHFRASATRPPQGSFQRLGGSLDATLASHARGALHLAAPASDGFWVDVVAEGLDDVPAALVDGALVFASAARDTDVVQLAQPGGVEEIRIVRALPANSRVVTARYRLALGPRVADVRVRAGVVELIDAAGAVRITTEPMFAVDVKGARRALDVSLEISAGARTLVATLDAQGLEAPIAIDPFWLAAASALPAATSDTGALTLADGRAVSFGNGAAGVRTAIFDPVTYKWAAAKDTVQARSDDASSMVRLSSGKVLIASGSLSTTQLATAELWDPTSGGVATPSMSMPHSRSVLVLVDSGKPTERALLLGGLVDPTSPVLTNVVEAYDVSLGSWVTKAPLGTARWGHTGTTLGDGSILVAGGFGSAGSLSTAEIYDPAGALSGPTTNSMTLARQYHTATKLLNGRVLIAGGQQGGSTTISGADLYDPTGKTFSNVPSLVHARMQAGATLLPDGRVLVIGGFGGGVPLSTTEIYDPTLNSWSDGPVLLTPRTRFAIAVLSGNRIVIAGGVGGPTSTYLSSSELLIPDPITCTTSATCASGNCVDGYCCDTPCVGSCVACDVPNAKGICSTIVAEAPHGSHPTCGLYAYCGASGSCSTNCGNDAGCAAGNFCQISGATGACVPKKSDGTACGGDNECVNAHCADGYCCNSACTGTCSACDVSAKLGVCSVVDGPVHGTTRPACANNYACTGGACAVTCTKDLDCALGRYCDTGTGTCLQNLANASRCTTSRQCASGNCVDGVCCNVACAGACQACDVTGSTGSCVSVASGAPHGTRSCGIYATCAAGACATSCAAAADCAAGYYCSPAGKCVTGKANAAVCASNLECTSGNCVDGVCCDKPCGAECESCAVAGKEGTCSPRPATAACGGAGCVGASLVGFGHCTGADNTCAVGSVAPCAGNLKCADAKTCKKTCAVDADCASGFSCDVASATCVAPTVDGGVADTGSTDSGTPDTAIDDTGVPDSGPADTGTLDTGRPIADAPAPNVADKPVVTVSFTRCARDGECPSHHCVEGVCCDTACKERCYSCALLTNPGVCTPEPVGVDLKHECGPGSSCLGTCGTGGECVGSGAGTMCARNRCTGPSTGVGPAFCAGPGADCPEGSNLPFDCAPFVCEPAFGACRSSCNGSDDCANGFLCDPPTGKCVAPVPTTDGGGASGGSGGCGVAYGGEGAFGAGGLAALGTALAFARRRRARAVRASRGRAPGDAPGR